MVNPSNVFTGLLPRSVDGMNITYNSAGQVTDITDGETVVKFTYGSDLVSRATDAGKTVIMIIEGYDEVLTLYMEVGNNGFVTYCEEIEEFDSEEEDTDYWWFGYNDDGQLNYMKRSEGGNEVTDITYTGGNITKVEMKSEEDDDSLSCEIGYTSDETPVMIDNIGCLMLFDQTFSIDMDEMKYAYFAGILGKPTLNLPVVNKDLEDAYTETYTWTLDANGYPVKMTSGWDEYVFEWVK